LFVVISILIFLNLGMVVVDALRFMSRCILLVVLELLTRVSNSANNIPADIHFNFIHWQGNMMTILFCHTKTQGGKREEAKK